MLSNAWYVPTPGSRMPDTSCSAKVGMLRNKATVSGEEGMGEVGEGTQGRGWLWWGGSGGWGEGGVRGNFRFTCVWNSKNFQCERRNYISVFAMS
jgi:hypothetical protein